MNNQGTQSLNTLEQQIRDNFDTNIHDEVQNACSMLQGVYSKYEAGVYTLDEAKKVGADLLRGLTYGADGYFWADTYDGVNVVLLGSATEGTSRIDTKDATGFEMVKAALKSGQQDGGGYIDYLFPHKGETEPAPKRGYTLAFKPFGWVIGTGNYTDNIDQYVAQQKAIIQEQISQSVRMILILSVISFLLALGLGSWITLSVIRPVKRLNEITMQLADGNLDAELDISSHDEVGQLAGSMSKLTDRLKTYIDYINEITFLLGEMGDGNLRLQFQHTFDGDFERVREALVHTAEMLRGTMNDISIAADQVASGSDQVSVGAQTLSQGATEQAASIEELAATINDIASQIDGNAKNAVDVGNLTQQAGAGVAESNKYMDQMVIAMDNISVRSNEIGKIIKTINDIAFQTNILALNAAVEAARAGSAGKGFAVVADEVRNLAQKSAEAAKNTTILIEETMQAVSNGTKIANETASSLRGVVENVEKVNHMIGKISDASVKQAEHAQQISQGVEQISAVVQTNSATAEESAAASEELSAQAQMLKDHVSKFHM
ncbi:Methyl-accepting chemotaxis protein 4 [bioreactor metagenome]|uniref:Methyl-accepting chemotaxis protein 4 n=1 Tax=bioreactor metagenome TaxID=1076179 RepID=A0A644ZR76_9ZZZZ